MIGEFFTLLSIFSVIICTLFVFGVTFVDYYVLVEEILNASGFIELLFLNTFLSSLIVTSGIISVVFLLLFPLNECIELSLLLNLRNLVYDFIINGRIRNKCEFIDISDPAIDTLSLGELFSLIASLKLLFFKYFKKINIFMYFVILFYFSI